MLRPILRVRLNNLVPTLDFKVKTLYESPLREDEETPGVKLIVLGCKD